MPFVSERQRRYLHIHHPDIAEKWEHEAGHRKRARARGDRVSVRKYTDSEHPRDRKGRWTRTSILNPIGTGEIPKGPTEARWAAGRRNIRDLSWERGRDFKSQFRGRTREAIENAMNLRYRDWGNDRPYNDIQAVARGDVKREKRTETYMDYDRATNTEKPVTREFEAWVDTRTGKDREEVGPYNRYSDAAKDIEFLDKAFADPKVKTDYDTVAYKGIATRLVKDLQSGDVFGDEGYSSVGLDPGTGMTVMSGDLFTQTGLEVFIPKGFPMIVSQGDKDAWDKYREGLLPRGTTFKVIDEYPSKADYPGSGPAGGWDDRNKKGGFQSYMRVVAIPPAAKYRKPLAKFSADQPRDAEGRWVKSGFGTSYAVPIDRGPGPMMTEAEAKEWSKDSVLPGAWYHGGLREGGARIEEIPMASDMMGRGYYVTRAPQMAEGFGITIKKLYVNVDKVLEFQSQEFEDYLRDPRVLDVIGENRALTSSAAVQIVAQQDGYQGMVHGGSYMNNASIWDASRVAVVEEAGRGHFPPVWDDAPVRKFDRNQPRDPHSGEWIDVGYDIVNGVPQAKPIHAGPGHVMSLEEARKWNQGSKLPGAFYRGTAGTRGVEPRIREQGSGFDLMGRGYYVTDNPEAAEPYAHNPDTADEGPIREVRLKVDKPLYARSKDWERIRYSPEVEQLADEMGKRWGLRDVMAAIQVVAQREGFDSYVSETTHNGKLTRNVAVWDARKVAVVDEDARARVTKYSATQPRDEKGRWTDVAGFRELTTKEQLAIWREAKGPGAGAEGLPEGVRQYMASGSVGINRELRDTEGKPDYHKEWVDQLDAYTRTRAMPEDLTLHWSTKVASDKVGDTFTAHGFVSASFIPTYQGMPDRRDVLIRAPKGQPYGLGNWGEREVILPRGMTFRVTNVSKHAVVVEPVDQVRKYSATQPRDRLGRWSETPGWKPTMSYAEAHKFVRRSAYVSPVYRMSKPENIERIKTEGFDPSRPSRYVRNIFGNGAYFSTAQGTGTSIYDMYSTQGRQEVTAFVRLENPVTVDYRGDNSGVGIQTSAEAEGVSGNIRAKALLAAGYSRAQIHNLAAGPEEMSQMDDDTFTQLIRDKGYDGIIVKADPEDAFVGGPQVIAFDKEQIVVIDEGKVAKMLRRVLAKVWDPAKHPRDEEGKFIRVKWAQTLATALKQTRATVMETYDRMHRLGVPDLFGWKARGASDYAIKVRLEDKADDVTTKADPDGVKDPTPLFMAAQAFMRDPAMQELMPVFGEPAFVAASRDADSDVPAEETGVMGQQWLGTIFIHESSYTLPMGEDPAKFGPDNPDMHEALQLMNPHLSPVSSEYLGMEGNIRHEYGHMVSTLMLNTDREGALPNGYGYGLNGQQTFTVFMHELDQMGQAEFARDISTYGATSPYEAFSECFAIVTSPNYETGYRDRYTPEAQRMLDWVKGAVTPR